MYIASIINPRTQTHWLLAAKIIFAHGYSLVGVALWHPLRLSMLLYL
jgi:hypothetical protein